MNSRREISGNGNSSSVAEYNEENGTYSDMSILLNHSINPESKESIASECTVLTLSSPTPKRGGNYSSGLFYESVGANKGSIDNESCCCSQCIIL